MTYLSPLWDFSGDGLNSIFALICNMSYESAIHIALLWSARTERIRIL